MSSGEADSPHHPLGTGESATTSSRGVPQRWVRSTMRLAITYPVQGLASSAAHHSSMVVVPLNVGGGSWDKHLMRPTTGREARQWTGLSTPAAFCRQLESPASRQVAMADGGLQSLGDHRYSSATRQVQQGVSPLADVGVACSRKKNAWGRQVADGQLAPLLLHRRAWLARVGQACRDRTHHGEQLWFRHLPHQTHSVRVGLACLWLLALTSWA
jgi:hypothetical protein